MARPLREFLNDFRLAAWYIGFLIACITAAVTATNWGWWAAMWDIALPARVLGILGVGSSAFVLWYGVLFTSHYYFGFPKQNPLSPSPGVIGGPEELKLRTYLLVDAGNNLFLNVYNDGPTDHFAAQISFENGGSNFIECPFGVRWEFDSNGKHEIIKGHAHKLQVLKFHRDEITERIESIEFFGPGGSDKIKPAVEVSLEGAYIYHQLELCVEVTSATTGLTKSIWIAVEMSAITPHQLRIKPYLLADMHTY